MDWTELSGKLNPSFDWEEEIQDVIGLDISLHKVNRCINNSPNLAQKYDAARTYHEDNCELGETDKVQGQISEHNFAPNGGYCTYYSSNYFSQHTRF